MKLVGINPTILIGNKYFCGKMKAHPFHGWLFIRVAEMTNFKPEEENMAKRRPFGWGKGIVPVIILVGVFFVIASVYSDTDLDDMRPDVLMIDLPAMPGGEKMPAVQFLHDVHTQRVQEKKNCSTCHLEKDQQFVFKFMRLDNGAIETDMAIYHENCIACHVKIEASGETPDR